MQSKKEKVQNSKTSVSDYPLVSIIIPCYNAEKYVAEAIQSALDQTYPNCEIIVIDDGSTDGSLDVIKSFGDKIRWETWPNRGGCAARNRGMELAKGDWIQFLDADDLIAENKISAHLASVEGASKQHMLVSNVVYFEDGTNPFLDGKVSNGYPALNSDNPVAWLVELWTPGPGYGTTRWGMVPHHAYLAPRVCMERAGGWHESLSIDQDGEFFTRVIATSNGVRWTPETYAYYRKFRSQRSTSQGRSYRNRRDSLLSIECKIETLEKISDFHWSEVAQRAIARQLMAVAVQATPLHPAVALRAWRRAQDFGGYPASEFFTYRSKKRFLMAVLPWPAIRIAQELSKLVSRSD